MRGCPVAIRLALAVGSRRQGGTRRERGDSLDDRGRFLHGTEREETDYRIAIRAPGYQPGLQQGADFGGEQEKPIRFRVVEGFLTEPIAREEEGTLPVIPERQRKHTVHVRQRGRAAADKSSEDDLRIARRRHLLPVSAKRLAQLAEVVALAVVAEREPIIGGGDRLARRLGQVQDRQPAMTENTPTRRRHVDPVAVRPPVAQRRGHATHHVPMARRFSTDNSRNPAHRTSNSPGTRATTA